MGVIYQHMHAMSTWNRYIMVEGPVISIYVLCTYDQVARWVFDHIFLKKYAPD